MWGLLWKYKCIMGIIVRIWLFPRAGNFWKFRRGTRRGPMQFLPGGAGRTRNGKKRNNISCMGNIFLSESHLEIYMKYSPVPYPYSVYFPYMYRGRGRVLTRPLPRVSRFGHRGECINPPPSCATILVTSWRPTLPVVACSSGRCSGGAWAWASAP